MLVLCRYVGVSNASEVAMALGNWERTWEKEGRDSFFSFKSAATRPGTQHAQILWDGMQCYQGFRGRGGFEICGKETPLHYQRQVEHCSQQAGNEITPHWKSMKTLKFWLYKDKLILTFFAFPKLAVLADTWKEMVTRRRVNINNYCVLPLCYPSSTWHFKSLKFNYIFAVGTLDSHSPMKKSIWEGFKLI